MNFLTLTLSAVLATGAGASPIPAGAGPPSPESGESFALRMNGHSAQAKSLLEDTLARNQKDAEAWFELARTEFYLMHLDDAEEAIDRAIALAPDKARYHHLAGVIAAYNSILKYHDPKTRGQSEAKMGKALGAFKKAVALDPDFHEARVELINMLLEAPRSEGGSHREAKQQVKILEGKDAGWGLKGRIMLDDVSPKKAVKLWKKMAASHPDRADAQAGLAEAYLRAGKFDLAVPHIEEAMRLDAGNGTLLLRLCRECFMVKDYAQAQRAVDQFLEQELPAPLRAYGTFCLAQVQKMQGHDEEAGALLAKAEAMDAHYWRTYMEPPEVLFDEP